MILSFASSVTFTSLSLELSLEMNVPILLHHLHNACGIFVRKDKKRKTMKKKGKGEKRGKRVGKE